MEGTMNNRRVLHRPAPRTVSGHAHSASQKPATAAKAQHVAASEKKDSFSKLTPVYAPTPRVAAERIRARYRGMDWVKTETVKKNVVKQVVAVEPPKEVVEEIIESQAVAPNIAERIAAELAENAPKTTITTTVTESVKTTETYKPAVTSTVGHSLSANQRSLLQQQFQKAVVRDAKHGQRAEIPKRVATKVRHHAKKAKNPRTVVAMFLVGVIFAGVYATVDSFIINQQAKQALAEQANQAQQAVQGATTTTTTKPVTTPTEEGNMVPAGATDAPTGRSASSHSVAPDLARVIKIPKLGINAPVISVGLTGDGAVDTPKNIWESAWYNGSAKPGENGAVLINGHSSANNGALFGHLERLEVGDTMQLEKGNGEVLTYRVVNKAIVPKDQVDMRAMMKPYGGASKGLNLITCQGSWVSSEQTLTDRILIWTEQI